MFEKNLKDISRKIFLDSDMGEYFILTRKKHHREMYFLLGDNDALKFAKTKFNSPLKKILYIFLRLNLPQPFLKKIKLSKNIGNVIFVGGQIKGFDLENNLAKSFPHTQGDDRKFIDDKTEQIKFSNKGFSPKIVNLDKKKCYSEEELFSQYEGDDIPIFNRLIEFYNKNGLYNKSGKHIKNDISKNMNKNYLQDPILQKAINHIPKNKNFLYTKIHGEFAKEQCLINDGKIYFVDLNTRDGLITEDLVNYFRANDNYFNTNKFLKILGAYPIAVKKNIKEYLIISELLRIVNFPYPVIFDASRIRLKKLTS